MTFLPTSIGREGGKPYLHTALWRGGGGGFPLTAVGRGWNVPLLPTAYGRGGGKNFFRNRVWSLWKRNLFPTDSIRREGGGIPAYRLRSEMEKARPLPRSGAYGGAFYPNRLLARMENAISPNRIWHGRRRNLPARRVLARMQDAPPNLRVCAKA